MSATFPKLAVKIIIAVPLLLGALWFLGAILSPPALFRHAYLMPQAKELAGTYRLNRESLSVADLLTTGAARQAKMVLREDHFAQVESLPEFDGLGREIVCSWTGKGSWSLETGLDGVSLTIGIDSSTSSAGRDCGKGPFSFGGFLVLGHSAPYRIWETVGDPDNGNGLVFMRE